MMAGWQVADRARAGKGSCVFTTRVLLLLLVVVVVVVVKR